MIREKKKKKTDVENCFLCLLSSLIYHITTRQIYPVNPRMDLTPWFGISGLNWMTV